MESFRNSDGAVIVHNLIRAIAQNRDYLSEIDGLTGDGDHGINMNKGFAMCAEQLEGKAINMSQAFKMLGRTLLSDIGGSMGPLYGSLFGEMAKASDGVEEINGEIFGQMLQMAVESVADIGGAKVGDKTLMDVLKPSLDAYLEEWIKSAEFAEALKAMCSASEKGRDSTKDMVAKLGRASRLGERSVGFLDAGSVSCCLILCTISETIITLLTG